MDLTGGLAQAVSGLPEELQPVMAEFVKEVFGRVDSLEVKLENFGNSVVGGVLADLTAERMQLVMDVDAQRKLVFEDIHALLDRLNGISLAIPLRKT